MKALRELDRVLRGDAPPTTGEGTATLPVSLGPLFAANVLLAAFYGLCMGVFGVAGRDEPEFRQLLADAVKVPLLFILTLFVTFPSLYVFNALVGSRLRIGDLLRVMAAAMGILLAVLAAFGPIVAFFSVTTTSYPFVVLLNVTVFTVAAVFGLSFLMRTIEKMTERPAGTRTVYRRMTAREEAAAGQPDRDIPLYEEVEVPRPATPDPAVRAVFRVWLVAFALVGAQMSWVLRPFIGSPTQEFVWVRPRDSSFFEGVLRSLRMLFGG